VVRHNCRRHEHLRREINLGKSDMGVGLTFSWWENTGDLRQFLSF
jgi:hypothetical protein